MRRRELLGVLAGSAVWPPAARAQPAERMRRIAVLMDAPQNDRSRPRLAAFVQGLMDLGWSEGRDMRIDIRWGADTAEQSRILAAEFLALGPDVVLVFGSPAAAAMPRASSKYRA